MRLVESARGAAARLVGVDDARRVVLSPGCTWSCHMAIEGVLRGWGRGARPRVVASALEHNAVSRALGARAAGGEIELVIVEPEPDGVVRAERMLDAAEAGSTALVCLTHASNVLGTIQPVRAVGEGLRAMGGGGAGAGAPLLLCDAAQTAGLMDVGLEETGADLIAFGAHKSVGGIPGVGVLVVGERAWADPERSEGARLALTVHGGTGGDEVDGRGRVVVGTAQRLPAGFEPGTANTIACAALRAAIGERLGEGRDERARAAGLIGRARSGLRSMSGRGVRVLGDTGSGDDAGDWDPSRRVGVLSFVVDGGPDPQSIASALDASFGIAVRGGLHCAPWCHEWLGTIVGGGAVRVSVGRTTGEAEIDRLLEAVGAIVG